VEDAGHACLGNDGFISMRRPRGSRGICGRLLRGLGRGSSTTSLISIK